MTAIPREQAEVHIRDVLTEFINMAQGVKDSGITVNTNGKRILDGLEIAKKALIKLEENYFAQLSDEGIQTFLDKCKILARQFELEQSKKIQSLNVYKDGTCITIRARHKDYDAENRKLVLYKNNEDIIFECSELPGFFDGSKERDVVWGVEKMVNGVFQRVTNLNPPYAIGYLFKDRYTLRFPEDGIYKVTADFIEYTKEEWDIRKQTAKVLDHKEIIVEVIINNTTHATVSPTLFTQHMFTPKAGFEKGFEDTACNATAILNIFSMQYTKETGKILTFEEGCDLLKNGVKNPKGNPKYWIDQKDADVKDLAPALNAMINHSEKKSGKKLFRGKFGYSAAWLGYKAADLTDSYFVDSFKGNTVPMHFVNHRIKNKDGYEVYDTYDGKIKTKPTADFIKQNRADYYVEKKENN